MQDPILYMTVATAALAAITVIAFAGLRGWHGWLDLKRAELSLHSADRQGENSSPSAATRIEVADLKERIRKLEAIAAGVDL
jgi:hypothetical protein